jgi:hypothetical protein
MGIQPNPPPGPAPEAGALSDSGRPRPRPPAPLGVGGIQLAYVNELTRLDISLSQEAALHQESGDLRETIRRAEIRATLRPDVDGKTAEIRKAQVEHFTLTDPVYEPARERLRVVDRDLLLARSSAEISRERLRLYRALLATLANGGQA